MIKKKFSIILFISLMVSLAGCSSLSSLSISNISTQNSQTTDPSKLSLEMKTGLGILELEDETLAVDSDQAKELLPLWQALKALSSDSNTAPEEISSLNLQIQDNLTAEQIRVIEDMSWDTQAISALAQKYGVQYGQGSAQNSDSSQSGTKASTSSSNAAGAGMPGDGAPPPDAGGMGEIAMTAGTTSTQTTTSRAAVPGQTERESAGGMNLIFADAVIKVLQEKLT